MNPKITEKEWLEDFRDFVSGDGEPVPEEISQRILKRINKALNPSAWLVFAKLFGIHAVVGTLSLTVCDQFGMSPFNTGISFSQYFMRYGHSFCMTMCGVLFMGLSVLFAWIILSREEFRVLRKNSYIQIPTLAVLSLAAFLAIGAEIVLGVGILWFIGTLLGGLIPTFVFNKRPAHL